MRATTSERRWRFGRQWMLPTVSVISLALLLVACVRSGDAVPEVRSGGGLEARIDAVAPLALEEGPLSGFSVAIARGDRIVLAKGFGFADVSAGLPAGADTVYRIGSISKPFLAAAIVRLAEQGRVSLDDSVATLLPQVAIDARITVRQLLSHTSGLANFGRMPGFEESQGIGMTRDEVVDWIVSQPLEYEPGTQWSYSNSGYLIAALVLEQASGGARTYMTDEIIQKAGLNRTRYCLSNEGPPETRGYHVVGEGWDRVLRLGRRPALIEAPPINMPLVGAVGPTCSTVTDLIRWLSALRHGDVVSQDSYHMMSKPVELPNRGSAPYGFGLQIREEAGDLTIGHSGLINGFVGTVRYFPTEDATIALLMNTAPPEPPQRMWQEIVRSTFPEDAPNAEEGNS